MKKILLLLIVSIVSISSFWVNTNADEIFWNWNTVIKYCNWGDCWLENWIDEIKWKVDWVEYDGKASEKIQEIVNYTVTFLAIVAVVLIVYAWFTVLTSAWDDEKMWNSKKIIIYAFIGLLIIYLARAMVFFFIDLLQ